MKRSKLGIAKPRICMPAAGERSYGSVPEIFLAFLAVFAVGYLLTSLLHAAIRSLLPEIGAGVSVLVHLFSTLATIVAVILWCSLYEKRTFSGLGFVRRGAIPEYLMGMLGGVILFGGAVVICVATGVARISIAEEACAWWLLLLFLVGFLVQGLSEELLCRSFLMVSLSRRWPLGACVLANAGIFALLHLFNSGVTVLSLLNIFLFGVMASLLFLRRGSVWMVAALHSLWNFAEGNLFGIPVSGITGIPSPLTTHISDADLGARLLGGGAFGIEGGLAATVVLVIGIMAAWLMPPKQSEVK